MGKSMLRALDFLPGLLVVRRVNTDDHNDGDKNSNRYYAHGGSPVQLRVMLLSPGSTTSAP